MILKKIFYKFLWNGKKDKFKRSIIINEYEEGGLKMPIIQSFYKALKMSWLHKLLYLFNPSPWKILVLGSMQKLGGSNI
jgi:hypothetical protein